MTRFSSLNLDELKALASEWGRNCPMIKKITLYHGYKEPYVLVAEIPELPKTIKKEKKTDEELEQEQEMNKWFDPLGAELLEDIATSKVAPDVNWEEWFFFVVKTEKEIPLKHFVHIESAETIYPITSIKKTPNNKGRKCHRPEHDYWKVLERIYKDLQENEGIPMPSRSDVRKRLKLTFKNMDQSPEETNDPLQKKYDSLRKKYDPDEIIQEVTKNKIYWRASTGKEKTHELSGIKDILNKLRNRKMIT